MLSSNEMSAWRSWVLMFARPGGSEHPIAVLLLDEEHDKLYLEFRDDVDQVADREDAAILAVLKDDFYNRAREMGAGEFTRWLEDTLSNIIRLHPTPAPSQVSDPQQHVLTQLRAAVASYRG
jgi:hypothetical protein